VEAGGRVVLAPEAGGTIFEAAVPVFATLLPPVPDGTEPILDALNSFGQPAALYTPPALLSSFTAARSDWSSLEVDMILVWR
jgi:hypothetical protein